MQSIERYGKSIETLNKIQETINSYHEQMMTKIHQEQSNRLQEYKKELTTKKIDFENINLGRSENAITQNIMARKKVLQKQCAASLEKSMKANKMYEELKQKLGQLEAEQRQMELETKYLQKRIVVAAQKNRNLKKIKEQFFSLNKDKEMRDSIDMEKKLKKPIILGQLNMNRSRNGFKDTDNLQKTKKWQSNTEKRLKFRIQCTKQYLESFIFVKTDLETIFEPFLKKSFIKISDKDKLQIAEQILSNPVVKRQLYQVLFPS